MGIRFTRSNVNRMLYAVSGPGHGLGDEATKYLVNGLHTGSDIGRGTRYIGMGGRMDVQHGPRGARKAVAYIYGMGETLGVWERLERLAETSPYPYARIDLDRANELAKAAERDLGEDTFTEWERLGQEYASKAR